MLDAIFNAVSALANTAGLAIGEYADPEKVRQRKMAKLKDQIRAKAQEVRDLYAKLDEIHNSVQFVRAVDRLPEAPTSIAPNFPAAVPTATVNSPETKPGSGEDDSGPKTAA